MVFRLIRKIAACFLTCALVVVLLLGLRAAFPKPARTVEQWIGLGDGRLQTAMHEVYDSLRHGEGIQGAVLAFREAYQDAPD